MQRRKRYAFQISIMHVCVDNFSPWRRCHESGQSYERMGRIHACASLKLCIGGSTLAVIS